MQPLASFIAAALGLALLVIAVGYLRDVNRVFRYLAEAEPDIWRALGSPVIPSGTGDPQIEDAVRNAFNRRIARFLMKREYQGIENRACVMHCADLRKKLVILRSCVFGLGFAVLLMILGAFAGP